MSRADGRHAMPLGLRLDIALCVTILAVSLALQSLALYVTTTFHAGVEIWVKTKVDIVPHWIASGNLVILGHREEVGLALWVVFLALFVIVLQQAAASLADLGVERPWSTRLMPITLLVPYLNLGLPWVGLHAARIAMRSVDEPEAWLDIPTIVFAAAFDLKLLGDQLLQVPDMQPNVFQGVARVPYYWTNETARLHFSIQAALSLGLLAVFWLYWRAFQRRYVESRAGRTLSAF